MALIVYLIAPALVTLATRHEPFALAVFTTLAAATVAIGWRTGAATAAVPAAGILDARAVARGDRLASHDPKLMNVSVGVETVDHPSDAATRRLCQKILQGDGSDAAAEAVGEIGEMRCMSLQRNLLYTGVTGGKQLVVLVGSGVLEWPSRRCGSGSMGLSRPGRFSRSTPCAHCEMSHRPVTLRSDRQ